MRLKGELGDADGTLSPMSGARLLRKKRRREAAERLKCHSFSDRDLLCYSYTVLYHGPFFKNFFIKVSFQLSHFLFTQMCYLINGCRRKKKKSTSKDAQPFLSKPRGF